MSTPRCRCGYQPNDNLDLLDHLQEVFIPLDGIAPDGRLHGEGRSTLACQCGFRASVAGELDAHFVAVFAPADRVGLDGREHTAP